MEALTRAVESGKTRYIGFSEWPADRIQAAFDMTGRRQVRVEPAAIFAAVARARGRSHPAVRRQRHLADRLVAARPGRAQRQVRSRPAAAAGFARRERGDGRLHGPPDAARGAPRGAAAQADRRGGGADAAAVRAGLGASRAQRRLGDHRRVPAGDRSSENAAASGVIVDTQLFLRAEQIIDEALNARTRLRSPSSLPRRGHEYLLDRQPEQLGDAKGQRKRGIVFAGLDRVHALPRHLEPLGEVLLAPVACRAQRSKTIIHAQADLSLPLARCQ